MSEVRDLLPLSSYEHTGRFRTVGQMVASGVMWGIPMLFFTMRDGIGLGRAFLSTAIGATFFGIASTLGIFSSARRKIRRRYAGDPELVSPPPAGRWDGRLQVTLIHEGRFLRGISGDLYVAPDLLHFVPLLDTPKRHRNPITVALREILRVDVIDRPEDWLTDLLLPFSPRYVEIWNGQQCLMMRVPEPDRVAESLRAYWQQGGAPDVLRPSARP